MTNPTTPVLQDRGEAAKAILSEPGIVLTLAEALALALLRGEIAPPKPDGHVE